MNNTYFLQSFFEKIEAEFDYQLDIDKYLLLLKTIKDDVKLLDYSYILQLCKALFLSYPKDEKRFETIFHETLQVTANQITELHILKEAEVNETNTETKNSNNEPIPSKENNLEVNYKSIETKNLSSQKSIGLDINPENFKTIEGGIGERKSTINRSYIFPRYFPPLTNRQLIQSWRRLIEYQKIPSFDEVDIFQSVKDIAKTGFLIEHRYKEYKVAKPIQFLFLVDNYKSMIAFEYLSKQLIDTVSQLHQNVAIDKFYFNKDLNRVSHEDKPYLYTSVETIISKLKKELIYVVIISDAGAADKTLNVKRINDTWGTLELVSSLTTHHIWINPMPLKRWKGTSAEYIALKANMFPILNTFNIGFDNAVKALKRKL